MLTNPYYGQLIAVKDEFVGIKEEWDGFSANRREEAAHRFQAGIRRAREIRDRAKQLLP